MAGYSLSLPPKITANGAIDYSGINVDPKLSKVVPYEFEIIDWKEWYSFIHRNSLFPIYAGLIYIPLIFGIQHFMRYRKPFYLRRELFFWNAGLGIFSIIGFVRFLPDMMDLFLQPGGLYKGLCSFSETSTVRIFWSLAFVLSKYIELGDTVFIVLRKKPLQFIQWYHHIATLAVCWLTMVYIEPVGQVFTFMNLGVHSLMYPYFALKALDIKIPRVLAMIITTLQLVQMLIGLFVNIYTAYFYYFGSTCYREHESLKYFFVVYGSFVILFSQLFYKLVWAQKQKQK